jgi:hypothetical protein
MKRKRLPKSDLRRSTNASERNHAPEILSMLRSLDINDISLNSDIINKKYSEP